MSLFFFFSATSSLVLLIRPIDGGGVALSHFQKFFDNFIHVYYAVWKLMFKVLDMHWRKKSKQKSGTSVTHLETLSADFLSKYALLLFCYVNTGGWAQTSLPYGSHPLPNGLRAVWFH